MDVAVDRHNPTSLQKIAYWLKLNCGKSLIRKRNFESCFGDFPEKYKEFTHRLGQVRHIEGDILEFGVHLGGTTCLIANYINQHNIPKHIFSFDSFCGFNPEEFETSYAKGAVTDLAQKDAFQSSDNNLLYVQMKLEAFGFDQLVTLYPGFFQETLDSFLSAKPNRQFSFALIDCDLDTSVQYCAEKIFDQMITGGIMLFDDYASIKPGKPDTTFSPGVRKVVDQFVDSHEHADHGYANGLFFLMK